MIGNFYWVIYLIDDPTFFFVRRPIDGEIFQKFKNPLDIGIYRMREEVATDLLINLLTKGFSSSCDKMLIIVEKQDENHIL
jgi:hypothetical protein